MAGPNEICRMDAVTLTQKVRGKEISPVEVVEAVHERMAKLEPILHAYCWPTPDLAIQQAKAIEQKILKGEEVGATAGVPVGIKDLVVMKDYPTVSGSIAYKDFIADEDDVVVERLKASDSIIVGKTNVPELGYSGVGHNPVFETTRNPWNTDLTPGGSSAGSAVSTATGMTPVCHRLRRRRLDSHSGLPERRVRHEGLHGPRAAVARHQR